MEPGLADLQRLVETLERVPAMRFPYDRTTEGIGGQAGPGTVRNGCGRQHLCGPGKSRDARCQIDGETFDTRMCVIPIGAGSFAHLAHVDTGPHAGKIGLGRVRLLEPQREQDGDAGPPGQ